MKGTRGGAWCPQPSRLSLSVVNFFWKNVLDKGTPQRRMHTGRGQGGLHGPESRRQRESANPSGLASPSKLNAITPRFELPIPSWHWPQHAVSRAAFQNPTEPKSVPPRLVTFLSLGLGLGVGWGVGCRALSPGPTSAADRRTCPTKADACAR